jgi:hypothetical protein
MLAEGIITDVGPSQRLAPDISAPLCSLMEGYVNLSTPRVRLKDIFGFIYAFVVAGLLMRLGSLSWIVRRIRRRTRSLRKFQTVGSHDSNPGRKVQERVAIYRLLRAFAFTTSDACLMNTLALGEFLHRSGIPVRHVFGVMTNLRIPPMSAGDSG